MPDDAHKQDNGFSLIVLLGPNHPLTDLQKIAERNGFTRREELESRNGLRRFRLSRA